MHLWRGDENVVFTAGAKINSNHIVNRYPAISDTQTINLAKEVASAVNDTVH